MQRRSLVVVWAVLLFCFYVEQNWFTVRTDHQALKLTIDLKEVFRRAAWWRLCLKILDLEDRRMLGQKHIAVDALSLYTKISQTSSILSTTARRTRPTKCTLLITKRTAWVVEPHALHSFASFQKGKTYCRQYAEQADARDSQYIYNEFSILSKCAHSDGATWTAFRRCYEQGCWQTNTTRRHLATLVRDGYATQWESCTTGLKWQMESSFKWNTANRVKDADNLQRINVFYSFYLQNVSPNLSLWSFSSF